MTLLDNYFGCVIRESIEMLKIYLDTGIQRGNYIIFRPLKTQDWKFYETGDIKGIDKLPTTLIIPQKFF